ncbi:MAG TPA: site-2 protease family protein [Candidatus Eremiobacteraceae bacterium]|nr:site-2 protease family protein [Candidatus Eremiobacteraceae bacterium]
MSSQYPDAGRIPPELLPPGYSYVAPKPPASDPTSGEPAPGNQPANKNGAKAGAAGIGLTILALWAKFKGLLVLLLNFKWLLVAGKLLLSGGSLIASIWLWSTVFGWPFATGFVLLIFVHEMGHVIAMYWRGIKASVPIFIPFFGAFIAMREMPPNARVEAEIAIAGPLLGTAGAAVCYIVGAQGGGKIWFALASAAFFINLFNMLPVIPLDGGRVVGALSPKLWIAGLIAIVALTIFWHGAGLLFILLIIALSWRRIVSAFHPSVSTDPYYQVPSAERLAIGLAYFGLAGVQAIGWHIAGIAAGTG